jgi:hypothetical protein
MFYRTECLEWNVPTKRLALFIDRMQGVPFENRREKNVVATWCGYVGVKDEDLPGTTDPATGRYDKVRLEARRAAFKACTARFNLADMIRQRDVAERECTRLTSNDFDRRSVEVIDCLLKRDALRKLALEQLDAWELQRIADSERIKKQLDERFGPKKQ